MKRGYLFIATLIFTACTNTKKDTNYDLIKGLNYYQKNDKVSALENFKKVYEKEPNNILVLDELGNIYSEFGEFEKAEVYYEKLLKFKPNNEKVIENLVNISYYQKNLEKMEEYLKLIVNKNSFLYDFTQLRIALLKKDYDLANKEFEKIIFRDINNSKLYTKEFYDDIKTIYGNIDAKNSNEKYFYEYFSKLATKKVNFSYLDEYIAILLNMKKYSKAEEVILNDMAENGYTQKKALMLEKIYSRTNQLEKLNNVQKLLKNKTIK